MGYSSCAKYSGVKLVGKNGIYVIGNKLGCGGNGEVYSVAIESSSNSSSIAYDLVVKILVVNSCDEKELKKRKDRFKKEITEVIGFQDKVSGIIPIY